MLMNLCQTNAYEPVHFSEGLFACFSQTGSETKSLLHSLYKYVSLYIVSLNTFTDTDLNTKLLLYLLDR